MHSGTNKNMHGDKVRSLEVPLQWVSDVLWKTVWTALAHDRRLNPVYFRVVREYSSHTCVSMVCSVVMPTRPNPQPMVYQHNHDRFCGQIAS